MNAPSLALSTPDANRPAQTTPPAARQPYLRLAAAGPASADVHTKASARRKTSPFRGELLLYVLLVALIGVAWHISHFDVLKSSGEASYWIGTAGATMMLLLFTYPLRKHVGFMRGLGKVKWWFWLHLFMGIAGPWLILVHSTFRIGSLNAGVALISMGIVVASGVAGRFIYVRVHRGLHGERTSLEELRRRAGLVESDARSKLHFIPVVEARLLAFEQHELSAKPGWLTHLRQVTILPSQQKLTYLLCVADARRALREFAVAQNWSVRDARRRERRARRLVRRYLDAVVRVAQYKAYERVFALWHLAHLPFVYLLVLSAVVHVVAVHAY